MFYELSALSEEKVIKIVVLCGLNAAVCVGDRRWLPWWYSSRRLRTCMSLRERKNKKPSEVLHANFFIRGCHIAWRNVPMFTSQRTQTPPLRGAYVHRLLCELVVTTFASVTSVVGDLYGHEA
eukprot:GEMP01047466.1.p1 GENE.GEMP01047466.1~~GEMP01047466.1.p1  ORF type:complete len:123 (+),score=18.42 GEMP01047466.1:470-838(+)